MIKTSTCIVGLKHKGITYIGGDSFGSNSYMGMTYNTKKVFHINDQKEIIVGYTSSFRMGQLIQYSNTLFNNDDFLIDNKINEKYFVNTFIPKLQDLFSKGGYQENNNDVLLGGEFLIAYKNKLFVIQCDYSILESSDDYLACGCGESFALGSLYTTQNKKYTPEERILLALESASKFSTGVSGPFYLVSTNNLDTVLLE
jgi:ATP-dependent protease HslVU (ClpYQ) peptidase subunit